LDKKSNIFLINSIITFIIQKVNTFFDIFSKQIKYFFKTGNNFKKMY